jgi:hypothetical protein
LLFELFICRMKLIYLFFLCTIIVSSCKTEEPQSSLSVITTPPTNISTTKATLGGDIIEDGSFTISEKGIVMSEKNTQPTINDLKYLIGNGKGPFSKEIDKLKGNTYYYFSAFATNSKGTFYGNTLNFSTQQAIIPSVVTYDPTEIGEKTAKVNIEISNSGGTPISEYGICISATNSSPTINDRKVILGTNLGNPPLTISNFLISDLEPNIMYYTRAYAINAIGIAYGTTKSFRTKSQTSLTLKNGLVAYYPFNGNTNDASTGVNHATNFGARFSTDRFNNANKSIEFPNQGGIRTSRPLTNVINNFTISVWAFTKNTAPNKPQGFTSGNSGDPDGPPIVHPTHGEVWDSQSAGLGIIFGTNQIQLVEHAGGYIFYPLVYSGSFSGWQHIVIVYENRIPKLYLNGKFVANGLQTLKSVIRPSNGCDPYGAYTESGFGKSFAPGAFNSSRQFNGFIDDYGIWNRALTPSEIVELYQIDFQP